MANKKKGNQKNHTKTILLVTAILNLIAELIELIKSISE